MGNLVLRYLKIFHNWDIRPKTFSPLYWTWIQTGYTHEVGDGWYHYPSLYLSTGVRQVLQSRP